MQTGHGSPLITEFIGSPNTTSILASSMYSILESERSGFLTAWACDRRIV